MKKYEHETFVIWQDLWHMDSEAMEDMKAGALETLLMDRTAPDAWEWIDDPGDPSGAGGWFRGTYSEDRILEMARELNDEYLEDERANLDRALPAPVWIWGTIGRWDGARSGASPIGSEQPNLNLCLSLFDSDAEITEIAVEGEELVNREAHHDGRDEHILRMEKPDMTDEERDDFLRLLESGHASEAMKTYTLPMGDMVREVYGAW